MTGVPKKVYMFTKDGELVKEFASMEECGRHFRVKPMDVFRVMDSGSIFKKWFVLRSSPVFASEEVHKDVIGAIKKKKKKAKPASIPSGTILEKKILLQVRDAKRAMNTVLLYDTINPSIPITVFGSLIKQMTSEGKIVKRGRWLWIGNAQVEDLPEEPRVPRRAANRRLKKAEEDLQKILDAANAEIGNAATIIMDLIKKRDKLLGISPIEPEIDARIVELVGQRECTVSEILGELGLPRTCASYPKQLYENGRIARKGYPRQEEGTTIRYATEDWYERNGIRNYVTPKRLVELSTRR